MKSITIYGDFTGVHAPDADTRIDFDMWRQSYFAIMEGRTTTVKEILADLRAKTVSPCSQED